MPAKKLPDTDEDRLHTLQMIIDRETVEAEKNVLSFTEVRELKNLRIAYESAFTCARQASDNEASASKNYLLLFQNAQMYVSHFMQVLYLATVRNEVKQENLSLYGLEFSSEFTLPSLATEEALIEWGERIINGETTRISLGGTAIYNPAITKVKVHYDLFKESAYSLTIYRRNTVRTRENLEDMRDKAAEFIWTAWTKVEFTYGALPPNERNEKYNEYGIRFYHNKENN
jgi:hypothetical protein